jgi:hypothetical protein
MQNMAKTSVKTDKKAEGAKTISDAIFGKSVQDSPSVSTPPNEKESTIPRLGVPFDPTTGKIVFEGMRPSTKEKIRTLLDDDRISKELGVSPNVSSASSPENDALAGVVVNVLYDAIGSLAVILAKSRGFGTHAELLRYTEQEKAQLAAPTLKVLGKYDLLGGKYADELLLVAAVGSITAGHIMAMTHAAATFAPTAPVTIGERVAS